MLSFLVFLQTNAPHIDWTGDQIRTVLMTLITGLVGYSSRLLYCMRDDVRDLTRDIHGDKDGKGGIKEAVRLHGRQIDWLRGKRVAQMILENAERDLHTGPERRQHLRRDRDVVNEAFTEDEIDFPTSTGGE